MAKLYPSQTDTVARNACVRRVVLLAILIAAGAARRSPASDKRTDSPQPPPLLRLLRESRASYHTVAVRFTQRKRLAILDITLESEGMIFFRRPGLIRYETLSPMQSLLLHDGKKVRCYAFSEGEWKLLRSPGASAVGQVLRQIGRWIQGDFDADRKMFEVDVLPADDGAGCIRLTPRSDALAEFIQRVELAVQKAPDYQVTRVTIRESDVDVTELRFGRELRNRRIPDGTFVSPEASAACQAFFVKEQNPDPNEVEKPPS